MSRPAAARAAVLFAPVAQGTIEAVVYGYGPLHLRQALGEDSLTVVTLFMGATALVTFLVAGAWGRLGDRSGRTLELMAGGLAGAGVGLYLLPAGRTPAAFIALAVASAGLLAAVGPLGVAWLTVRSPRQPALEAARFYRGRSIGWAVGSFGTSYLVRAGGIAGVTRAFWAGGGLALVAALTLAAAALRRRRPAPIGGAALLGTAPARRPDPGPAAAEPGAPEPAAGPIWRNPFVAGVALTVVLTAAGNEAFFAVLATYLTEFLGGPPSLVGLSLGVASTLGIAVIGPVGHLADRWGPERVLFLGTLGYTAMYALVILARNPVAVTAAFAVPLYPFLSTGATGVLARRTSARRRGEAIGLYEGGAALAATAGSLAAGLVADALGLPWVPVLSVSLAAAGALAAWTRVVRAPAALRSRAR